MADESEQKKLQLKLKRQVARYERERPRYVVYGAVLRRILQRACRECEVLGFVQVRAKGIASFAEKITRKGQELEDPVTQFTDLCGGRVITQTQQEVDRVCDFIRRHFKIDEKNTPDVASRLGTEKFGYRSDHLIVQMPWATLEDIRLPGAKTASAEERLLADIIEENLEETANGLNRQGAPGEPANLRSWQGVAEFIGNRKAEIQVRTLLQHAWAAISHDRVYKSEFETPPPLERQIHRMAALLEEADGEFQEAVDGVDTYNLNYAAYLEPDGIEAETSRWRAVLPYTQGSGRHDVAMKIARLARAGEDWDGVVEALGEHTEDGIPGLLRDLGLTDLSGAGGSRPRRLRQAVEDENWEEVRGLLSPHTASDIADMLCEIGLAESIKDDRSGRGHLEDAVNIAPENVDAHCYLGDTYCERSDTYLGGSCAEAHQHYGRAFELAPSEPRALRCYLECSLCRGKDFSALRLLRPGLEAAIETCRERAAIGVYVPHAYYDAGIFELMLDRPYESLSAFAKAVHHSRTPRKVEQALSSVEKLQEAAQEAVGGLPSEAPGAGGEDVRKWLRWCEWLRRFLLLARAAKLRELALARAEEAEEEARDAAEQTADEKAEKAEAARAEANHAAAAAEEADRTAEAARQELSGKLATEGHEPVAEPVVIVAGGTDQSVEEQMVEYGTLIMRAFAGFEGTIISGGTTAGICGVIGGMSTGGAVHKVSYLLDRHHLPPDATLDTRYEIREPVPLPEHLQAAAADTDDWFTALEPIQCWIDLFCQGVAPEGVTVLGINGGRIAAFEYRLALALGAAVGIIQSSGRAAEWMLQEAEDWKKGALLWLPGDPMVLKAFVQPPAEPQGPFDQEGVLDRTGRAVHEKYREDKIASADPALKPWDRLDETYKEANRQQVLYAGRILATQGYALRPVDAPGEPVKEFTDGEEQKVERMAEMEHGRWVAERLRNGWQYGPERDKKRKTSPYLCSWAEVPDDIKDYDRKAVRDWPEVMAEAGLKIVRAGGEIGNG